MLKKFDLLQLHHSSSQGNRPWENDILVTARMHQPVYAGYCETVYTETTGVLAILNQTINLKTSQHP